MNFSTNNRAFTYSKDKAKFATEQEYWGKFGFGEWFQESNQPCGNSTSTQCELIQDDKADEFGLHIPSFRRYKHEEYNMSRHFLEFCYKTSAHGIPMIGQAPNRYYRVIWIVLFVACVSMLYQNARSVLIKYNRSEKIVDIQLKFDNAPFPAITLCNLNPYKASDATRVELIRRTLLAFDKAMNKAGIQNPERGLRARQIVREAVNQAADLIPFPRNIDEETFNEAMGFEGMTDEVAIVTKAKENILFAMAAMPIEDRLRLSTQKHELIQKCSFSGKACDIENDFLTHVDPIFGSCFTFNFNRTNNLTSIKAGPMYGLRMLVYCSARDYMPTTEATGIRLTIHDKEDYPYPDTFGYSAPTGFASSFGLKLKKMSRLPAPYGDCLWDGANASYIYQDYEYTVEGCYRSCFQQRALKKCQCGDPRFPVPAGQVYCLATDFVARKCLEEHMNEIGGYEANKNSGGLCRCHQPCRESIYSVTYSPARWPSQSLEIKLGNCNSTPAECIKHYRENGAMIEVFYEQLNFELLTESEAYGFVNLLADFGGQLGLWCGISFLTCCEFVFLFFETLFMAIKHNVELYRNKKATL